MAKLLTDDEIMRAGPAAAPRLLTDDEIMAGASAPSDPPKVRGIYNNATGGANGFIASALGFPADLVNAIGSPAAMAGEWVVDKTLPLLGLEPRMEAQRAEARQRALLPGGSGDVRTLMEEAGIATDRNAEAVTTGEKMARGAGEGIASTVVPMGAARALQAGISRAPGAVRAVLEALGAGGLMGNSVAGGLAGASGALAEGMTNDPTLQPLANFGGQMVGGGIAAATVSGLKRAAGAAVDALTDVAAPLSIRGRERMVADRMRGAAQDPSSLLDRLHTDGGEMVPGSRPTTYQTTGDTGIGALERGVAAREPAPFMDRRAEQNAARMAALEGLAPADAQPVAVRDLFKRQLDQVTSSLDQQIAKAVEVRGAAVDSMAAAADAGAAGSAMRDALSSVKASEKAALSKLYAAVDPDGFLTLDIAPAKVAARDLLRNLPKASALGADENRIFSTLASMPDVERFGEMTALRSELLAAIRAERFTRGETPALRRMTMLREAVDGLIAEAADAADGGVPSNLGASSGGLFDQPAGGASVPAMSDRVYTPSGRSVGVRYEVVDASALRPASGPLQPRDRSRAASDVQIRAMAQNLQPERLGASPDGATGAPIIGPDGVIESGNGRVAAIRQAYAVGGRSGAAYRDWLAQQYPEAANIREPVLVRRRTEDLPMADRVRLVQEWNSGQGLSFSASERAAIDADRLSPAVLSLYRGGDLAGAENVPFLRAFMQSVADRGEVNALAAADGRLSAEGLRRVRTALLHKAYQDGGLVASLAEAGDEGIRAIGEGLTDAAPAWALLREEIAAGRVRPEMDITPAVLDAVRIVQSARAKGMTLADAVAQVDAFNAPSPEAVQLLQLVYGEGLTGRASRHRMAGLLNAYAQEAGKASADPGLLLDLPDVLPADILQTVGVRSGGSQGQSGGAAGTGAGGGAGGSDGRGFGPAAAGAADAGRRGSRRTADLTPEALTPNFDADAAARYRAASDGYRDYAERFKGGPVGAALRAGPGGQGFNLSDAQVASRFWGASKRAADDVRAFRAALGDDARAVELLGAEAARSLRDTAVKPDGTVDAGKFLRWLQRHGDAVKALEAIPGGKDVAARLRAPEKAQAVVDALTEGRGLAIADIQKSAARLFLDDADPVSAVGAALSGRGGKTPAANMFDLALRVAKDKDAQAGLKRATLDYLKQRFISNTEAGDTGLGLLKSDQFQTFVREKRAALLPVFDKEGVDTLQALAADLRRANRSIAGAKLPGGSNTTQDTLAATKGQAVSVLRYLVASGTGAGAGATVGGPMGAIAGTAAVELMAMARRAGMRKVDALLTEAMLDPALARKLLEAYQPDAKVPGSIIQEMGRRLGLVGVGAATTAAEVPDIAALLPIPASWWGSERTEATALDSLGLLGNPAAAPRGLLR